MTEKKGFIRQFRDFAVRGNVIDLAVGIIIGAAFTGIVNSLVNDIVMPVIGITMKGIDFSDYFIALDGAHYRSLKDAQDAGAATLNYGLFLNHVLNFVIVSLVVFVLVRQVSRLKTKLDAAPTAPTKTESLLEDIKLILQDKLPDNSLYSPSNPRLAT